VSVVAWAASHVAALQLVTVAEKDVLLGDATATGEICAL
jgi:hypothetical protein